MRDFLHLCVVCALLGITAATARSEPQWLTLPATPSLPPAQESGYAPVNGIKIWYAEYGQGEPVILLHGGLANGRRSLAGAMERSWDFAMHHPDRVTKLFAFAANSDPSAVKVAASPVFNAFISRAEKEYETLSPTSEGTSHSSMKSRGCGRESQTSPPNSFAP
jgi:hypothetical protein